MPDVKTSKAASEAALRTTLTQPHVTFIVGDSAGLDMNVVEAADEVMSLAHMEISHGLEACVLLDQLERILKT